MHQKNGGSDIEEKIREIYEIEFSMSTISIITNKVNQTAQEWQNRPWDSISQINQDGMLLCPVSYHIAW